MKKVEYIKDNEDKLRDYNPFIILHNLGLTPEKTNL